MEVGYRAGSLEPTWRPSAATRARAQVASRRLVDEFSAYLRSFASTGDRFAGPDLHFHLQAIRRRRSMSAASACLDERFLEYVYATLACWGMHRMGETATKLVGFDQFTESVASLKHQISDLDDLAITELADDDSQEVMEAVGAILDALEVGRAVAKLVANSKVLHHLLPDLVPPIDRRYTLAFFGINELIPSSKQPSAIFRVVYPEFMTVARSLGADLLKRVDAGLQTWHSSPTKVLDNAIMGAALSSRR